MAHSNRQKKRCPRHPPRGGVTRKKSKSQITQQMADGEYILYMTYADGTPYTGIKNTLGELTAGEALDLDEAPDNIDPCPA